MVKFYNFYTEKLKDRKIKIKSPEKDSRLRVLRGMNRKKLNQIPDYRKPDMSHSDIEPLISRAKKTSRGVWGVTKRQVIELSNKYKFLIPNDHYPTKHLGSTGIILWRKGPNKYFLIKRKKQEYNR